jgi:betaine reductase
MMSNLRVVHYLNQFFAGVGGEEKAGEGPQAREGAIGPGRVLVRALGADAKVVGTVYCGDDYVNEQADAATAQILEYVGRYQPDLVVAGPAFNAGRYGLACGRVCTAVQEGLGLPTVTGMYPENPAVTLYRQQVYIVPTEVSAAAMAPALERMAALGLKLARGERLGLPAEEGYLPRGLRFSGFATETAATRAVDMLLKRLRGEAFETEWPLPEYDRVLPPPPIRDLSKAKVALVTSGGIVPRNNPDRIESTFATKWLKYNLAGVTHLTPEQWQSVHGGYDTTNANEDPNRVLPIDVARELEAEGTIGRLHDEYFVTVGSGASTAAAKRFAHEILDELKQSEVDAVIFTAT